MYIIILCIIICNYIYNNFVKTIETSLSIFFLVQLVKGKPLVLFMKGNPSSPMVRVGVVSILGAFLEKEQLQ